MFSVFAHAQEVETVLNELMQIERSGEYSNVDDDALYEDQNREHVLDLLEGYYSDTTSSVRYRAYKIAHRIAKYSEDPAIQEPIVQKLVSIALADENSGNKGAVMNFLTTYPAEAFSESSRDRLVQYLSESPSHRDRLFKLIGFVPGENASEQIQAQIQADSALRNSDKWAAYLALARMGDERALNRVVTSARAIPVNDDFVYELAPDLLYTRQKEAVNYLIEILNSNSEECYSSDPDNSRPILCGYRLIEYFAPVVQDYPYELGASGDLDIADYENALLVVREWFFDKGDGYVLEEGEY